MGEVGSLFSSPSKQAEQTGQAEQGLAQNEINQAENYVNTSESNQRAAIAGLGDNPYFGSTTNGQTSSPLPAPTQVNPSYTASFGPTGQVPQTPATPPTPNPNVRRTT